MVRTFIDNSLFLIKIVSNPNNFRHNSNQKKGDISDRLRLSEGLPKQILEELYFSKSSILIYLIPSYSQLYECGGKGNLHRRR